MKTVQRKKVITILRSYGLRPAGKMQADGHELWVDEVGRRVHPPFRKKELHLGEIYSLGLDLEAQGIIPRRRFHRDLKGQA